MGTVYLYKHHKTTNTVCSETLFIPDFLPFFKLNLQKRHGVACLKNKNLNVLRFFEKRHGEACLKIKT